MPPRRPDMVQELLQRGERILTEQRVRLTPEARSLLNLAADAWIHDPPRPSIARRQAPTLFDPLTRHSRDVWLRSAETILRRTLQDERVRQEVVGGEVTFAGLFHALEAAARAEVRSLGFKD